MIEELPQSLLEIVKKGEMVTTEFKEAKSELPKNLFESICSFLNRKGGHIFLGINDKREIIGVNPQKVEELKKNFATLCNNPQKISPTVYLELNEYIIEEKMILYCYVYESSDVHKTNNRIFDRNRGW